MQSFLVNIPINLPSLFTIGKADIQFSSIKLYASLFEIQSFAVIGFLVVKFSKSVN
jgi:hypothetical protein